jgi:hypothetical protein
MVASSKLVKVTPESTVDELLDDADCEPIVVERNGVRYQVSRETDVEDIWEGWDQEKALRSLDEVAGTWSDYDTKTIIANLYQARIEGSRPIGRP